MKKLLSIILIALLSFSIVACNGNNTSSTATSVSQSALSQKLKAVLEKPMVKELLQGKKISELLKESITNITEDQKNQILKELPGISLDPSNFSSDDAAYAWIADTTKQTIKAAIEKGELTQDIMNQAKMYLGAAQFQYPELSKIKIPNIELKKGISDEDLTKFCESMTDVLDVLTDPELLKKLGVDLSNLGALDNLQKMAGMK